MEAKIRILVNERPYTVQAGTTADQLLRKIKPRADIILINSFPHEGTSVLKAGDRVVFIRRGEIPDPDEIEALLVARHTPGVYECLKRATVGVAGLGGLGSSLSLALARMGIGTLILADDDVIEPSNLNRQQYFIDQIGLPKVKAMADIMARINPSVTVVAHKKRLDEKNIPRLFVRADVIVECFDRAEAKKMILETVSKSLPHTYFIGASGLAGLGDSNSIKTWRLSDRIFLVGDLKKESEPGRGLMAPRVGIAAHHQANIVVSLLVDPEQAVAQSAELPSGY